MTKTLLLVAFGLVLAASGPSAVLAGAASSPGPTPAAARTITLHGSFSAPAGWGWTANNITEPGPTLTVNQGDVITFRLYSNDSVSHMLVIDLNNDQMLDAGDQNSTTFSSPTVATTWTFTASTAGTFDYFCGIHGYAAQHGTFVVLSTGGGGGGGGTTAGSNTTLLIGGIIIVVAIIAVAAAVVMRRKKP